MLEKSPCAVESCALIMMKYMLLSEWAMQEPTFGLAWFHIRWTCRSMKRMAAASRVFPPHSRHRVPPPVIWALRRSGLDCAAFAPFRTGKGASWGPSIENRLVLIVLISWEVHRSPTSLIPPRGPQDFSMQASYQRPFCAIIILQALKDSNRLHSAFTGNAFFTSNRSAGKKKDSFRLKLT